MLRPHRASSRGSSLARQGSQGAQDAIRTGIHVDRRDVAPADDPVTVDDEQRSLAEPVAVAVHAVTPRHRPFGLEVRDRKSTRLNSSHSQISYAVFCLKKK